MDQYIEFPGFGWEFPISDTIVKFTLFNHSFSIKWYGLLIAVGFILAVFYALKRAKNFELDPDKMIDVVLVSTLAAFVGARLYYIVFSADRSEYFSNPISMLWVWKGGLAIYGGIIFAFVSAIIMCRVRKARTLAMFDIASLGFLIGQAIGRWGNFFNQEAFGGLTNLPWRMSGSTIYDGFIYNQPVYGDELATAGVHPTFLYESLWCIAGFVLLHLLSKKFYKFKGQIFSSYLVWYGVGRFFIEGLRTDSLYLGQIRVSQLVSALVVIGGVVLMLTLRGHERSSPVDLFAPVAGNGIMLNDECDIADIDNEEDAAENAEDNGGEISQETEAADEAEIGEDSDGEAD